MMVGTIFVGLEINLTSSGEGDRGLVGAKDLSALGRFGLDLMGGSG